MELLERKQFLVELEAILKDIGVGGGRFVLISGEAGIGKTSLVERFAKEHEKGASVLWGACDALFTPRPLGPLYDIAHQTQGNLLELLEAEAPRARGAIGAARNAMDPVHQQGCRLDSRSPGSLGRIRERAYLCRGAAFGS